MKIAISGKGGVGKTTIMATIADQCNKMGKDVLVIDADPSPHMAQTIGFDNIEELTPIAEMKKLLIERSGKTEGSSFYNINPQVDDILKDYMITKDGIKLMVLGAIQTAKGGCACPENNVLRRLLTKLLLSPSQIVLLDMEAGVEHLGRGTIVGVDHLLVVVIPTQSGIRTAKKINKLAQEAGIPLISYVGNLVEDDEDKDFLIKNLDSPPVAFFPKAKAIRKIERQGLPVIGVAGEMDSEARQLIEVLLSEPQP